MTLQQLKYIIALDHKRHYIKAAEECFVTQPTLTIQVKKLEEEIGTTIFDRNTIPLTPTPIGKILIAKAKSLLREADEFKEIAYSNTSSLSGKYTLGIIPTIAPYLLPLFLESFLKNNPNTKLIIKEMQTDFIIDALHNGTLDIGIVSTPLEDKMIREINLYQEPFLVYCKDQKAFSSSEIVKQDDLTPDDLLILEEGHCFRNQTLNICQDKEKHRNKAFLFESGSIQTVKNMVKAGLGYTLVPQLSITEDFEKKYIKSFATPKPTREVSIVVNKNFTKEKLIENLLLEIKNNIPKQVKEIDNYIKIRWK
ncbi:LysR substrate-binding domain-containing protein [Aquimarina longa]|uniref:LysR substrate-binding domain-containing protein n=1 Tax=Aquimarina longa TaxID=1080221 RepID=UPI0007826FAF|nr:LysR substrate-binding domain-containing protein [Aquimarina longa]